MTEIDVEAVCTTATRVLTEAVRGLDDHSVDADTLGQRLLDALGDDPAAPPRIVVCEIAMQATRAMLLMEDDPWTAAGALERVAVNNQRARHG